MLVALKSKNNAWYKKQLSSFVAKIVKYVILTGLCFIILYPLFLKFTIVFMDKRDLYDASVKYIPKHFTLDNLMIAINSLDYFKTLFKTSLFVLLNGGLQIISCTLVAYGFARFDFPCKKLAFSCVLLTLIMPAQSYTIPLYFNFRNFNFFGLLGDNGIEMLGTILPSVLLSATATGLKNGLFIYMLRQFFRSFPKELEEAGSIDGAGTFKIFHSIILPSAVPLIATCFLFSLVWQWTDSFYTNIFMPDNTLLQTQVLSLGQKLLMQSVQGTGQTDYFFASIINNTGLLLFILPLLILYCFLQRLFVESIERSGIVG